MRNNKPLVTVGISFHNAESTIVDAVRSVFAQSLTDWQLILIDDGSTDRTLDIVRDIEDTRVTIVSDGRNRGLASRLNQIVELAEGKYLARMDADDLMDPKRFVQQVSLLESRPSLDLVDTGLYSIDDADQLAGRRCCEPLRLSVPGLMRGKTPVHAAVVSRTEWSRRHRYNVAFRRAQDYELWNRAYRTRPFHFARVCEPLYFARESSGNGGQRTFATFAAKRQVLKQYGPTSLGMNQTLAQIGISYGKQLAYGVANTLGLQSQLIATRNQPPSDQDRRQLSATLGKIRSAQVPGWEDTVGTNASHTPASAKSEERPITTFSDEGSNGPKPQSDQAA